MKKKNPPGITEDEWLSEKQQVKTLKTFHLEKFKNTSRRKCPLPTMKIKKKAHFNLPIIVIATIMANTPLWIQFLSLLRTKRPNGLRFPFKQKSSPSRL